MSYFTHGLVNVWCGEFVQSNFQTPLPLLRLTYYGIDLYDEKGDFLVDYIAWLANAGNTHSNYFGWIFGGEAFGKAIILTSYYPFSSDQASHSPMILDGDDDDDDDGYPAYSHQS